MVLSILDSIVCARRGADRFLRCWAKSNTRVIQYHALSLSLSLSRSLAWVRILLARITVHAVAILKAPEVADEEQYWQTLLTEVREKIGAEEVDIHLEEAKRSSE